jgi:hypothetical protein
MINTATLLFSQVLAGLFSFPLAGYILKSVPAEENGLPLRLIFFLGGGLLVLLIAFALVVIYLYQKFKRKY